ncbi:MAG: protein-L-isoaspartate(D-aspartate) O-methyltransferase [bacterium]
MPSPRPAALLLALALAPPACADKPPSPEAPPAPTAAESAPPARQPPTTEEKHAMSRKLMVERHLAARDITDRAVLDAMATVPRDAFVRDGEQAEAYADHPLPIGHGQTISQPYIVALMTQLARARPGMKALDVGTGSGYQAAVLSRVVDHVYGIEIVCPLADRARVTLAKLGYDNVTVRCGDGYRGWPEHAPFDVIILAAAPERIPEPLIEQLAPGGRLVLPVGEGIQQLKVVTKGDDGTHRVEDHGAVRFVPMTGEIRGDAPAKAPGTAP